MRIRHTSQRRSQRDLSRMSLTDGGAYLHYFPSDTALAIINQWRENGVGMVLELELDNETQRTPMMLYFIPATNGGGAWMVRQGRTGSPYISVRVTQWPFDPRRLQKGPQTVEETVTPTEIAVRIPFNPIRADQAA